MRFGSAILISLVTNTLYVVCDIGLLELRIENDLSGRVNPYGIDRMLDFVKKDG